MQSICYSQKPHNELPPPVKQHGQTFSLSAYKAAIMAHKSPNPWTTTLPAVLLSVCSAVKELLGRSAAEMNYGTRLRLPDEFTEQYTVNAHTDIKNYYDKLGIAMSRFRLCPLRDTPQKYIFQYKELEAYSHVFLRRIAIAPPLTTPYDGPYKVISKSGRVMKILMKGKVETDHVKHAHFEHEPKSDTNTKRQTQPKNTSLKPAAIARGPRRDPLGSSSAFTSKSAKTGVKPNLSAHTKF